MVLDAVAAALAGRAVRHAPLGARTTYRVGGTAVCPGGGGYARTIWWPCTTRWPGPARRWPCSFWATDRTCWWPTPASTVLVVVPGPGLAGIEINGTTVRAGGGANFPLVARRSAAAGLVGLEWAVGVPGTVGGALKMNAGGHGSDTAAVLARQRVYDAGLGTWPAWADPIGWPSATGTRRSAPTTLWCGPSSPLAAGVRAEAETAVAEIVRWRRAHQPGGSNAGSVFTNPDGDAAGRLVEAVGLKGFRLGTARVSEKHANFIQADDDGSADDVKRLIDHVRAGGQRRRGVDLVPEVCLVGFDDGERGKPSTSRGGSGA